MFINCYNSVRFSCLSLTTVKWNQVYALCGIHVTDGNVSRTTSAPNSSLRYCLDKAQFKVNMDDNPNHNEI